MTTLATTGDQRLNTTEFGSRPLGMGHFTVSTYLSEGTQWCWFLEDQNYWILGLTVTHCWREAGAVLTKEQETRKGPDFSYSSHLPVPIYHFILVELNRKPSEKMRNRVFSIPTTSLQSRVYIWVDLEMSDIA